MSFFSNLMDKVEDVVDEIKEGDIEGALNVASEGIAQEKIDEWAKDVKEKAEKETERVVYEKSHEKQLADGPLRAIIEEGVNSAELPFMDSLGPVAENFIRNVLIPKMEAASSDDADAKTSPVERWVKAQLDRQNFEEAIRGAALRSFDRYLTEHKEFLMQVAVEALLQKVSSEDKRVSGTNAQVPYERPPSIAPETGGN